MIQVFDEAGCYVGDAESFGAARRLQLEAIAEPLRYAYAGIGTEGQPLFHTEMLTPDQLALTVND